MFSRRIIPPIIAHGTNTATTLRNRSFVSTPDQDESDQMAKLAISLYNDVEWRIAREYHTPRQISPQHVSLPRCTLFPPNNSYEEFLSIIKVLQLHLTKGKRVRAVLVLPNCMQQCAMTVPPEPEQPSSNMPAHCSFHRIQVLRLQ